MTILRIVVLALAWQALQAQALPPKLPELDQADKIRLLEAQRFDLAKNEQYQRARADMLEAQKAAVAASAEVDRLVQELRSKYACNLCELGWDHKWTPAKGTTFLPPEKKPPAPEVGKK